jgi:hypothetical protein
MEASPVVEENQKTLKYSTPSVMLFDPLTLETTMLGYAASNWTIDFSREWWDQWRRSTDG